MDNKRIENIVTYSNLLELTKRIVKEVGFEFQAALDDSTLDEVVSSQVMACVNEHMKRSAV